MEAIRSLQSYWRRRTYQRLESLPAPTKKEALPGPTKEAVVSFRGRGGGKRGRRSCKAVVVVRPVVRLKKLSVPKTPGRVIERLRDAYMNVMLMLAGDGGATAKKNGDGGVVWDRRIPKARQGCPRGGDFEKRILIHLYNSVIDTR